MSALPEEKPGGKGRPTPKRRDAEKRRKAITAPKSRKEAAKLQREMMREKRGMARKAMATGDTRYLPKRDAGPARAYARDYVDSRRHASSYFLPFTLGILIFASSPVRVMRLVANGLLFTGLLVVLFDGRRLGRKVTSEVEKRWPDEQTKGLRMYAVMRAMQFRRLRMPKARVKLGDSLD
ncbi:MAG: hypothetical protein QOG53_3384 [Frankiales bacterium]|nr:hypothetical protein [Frankiales bacterium]